MIFRSARETYGDSAIGYVKVKRSNSLCIVQCRITPEHKVTKTPYRVRAEIDEGSNVLLSVSCQSCATSEGGCLQHLYFGWTEEVNNQQLQKQYVTGENQSCQK